MTTKIADIFDEVREFPDPAAQKRYASLVGLDSIKSRLIKEASILLNRESLDQWSTTHHGQILPVVAYLRDRPPLFIFAGDVGTGKTALAESFSDPIARSLRISITLYELSLNARGNGAVGQMTTLLTAAIAHVREHARKSSSGGRSQSAVVLLVDEADALAQSREAAQMHHEDRAGVNALIRGVDDLADGNLPAIVVLCTNRLNAIDPAVRRRAAETFVFERPGPEQRQQMLVDGLNGIGLTGVQIADLIKATGPVNGRTYGMTFSDIRQRLLPSIVLAAYPDRKINHALIKSVVDSTVPTPPFREQSAHG